MKDFWTKTSENIFTGVIGGGIVVIFTEQDKTGVVMLVTLSAFTGLAIIKYVTEKGKV